eukprot:TRINITY_DN10501_c0_g2_i5.p1 TRINITY_DN10501_c0_g2~~TRINITY_DN10501_c0_g2_i5.p1  ORF type:complete len:381 (-),score=79.00 TRINITY_DN10501_c0_g2_i5:205-1347(-)
MVDIAGAWYYSKFVGGRCEIATDSGDGSVQLSFKSLTGGSKRTHLRQADDGWWYTEGLRLRRDGEQQLVLQRAVRSGWSKDIYAFSSAAKASGAYLKRNISNSFYKESPKREDDSDSVRKPGLLQRGASGLKDTFVAPSRQPSTSSVADSDKASVRRSASGTLLSVFVSPPRPGSEASPHKGALKRASSDVLGLFVKSTSKDLSEASEGYESSQPQLVATKLAYPWDPNPVEVSQTPLTANTSSLARPGDTPSSPARGPRSVTFSEDVQRASCNLTTPDSQPSPPTRVFGSSPPPMPDLPQVVAHSVALTAARSADIFGSPNASGMLSAARDSPIQDKQKQQEFMQMLRQQEDKEEDQHAFAADAIEGAGFGVCGLSCGQ